MIFSPRYTSKERAVVGMLQVLGLESETIESRPQFRGRLRDRLVAEAASGEHLGGPDLCQAC